MAHRSALFVPGSRPERFSKAVDTLANRVIVDFEDAVEPELKAQAHDNLSNFLTESVTSNVMVRINASDTAFYEDDLRFCREHPQLKAVMVPKAESPAQLLQIVGMGHAVWPLVESAKALLRLNELAEVKGVELLSFGALDLAVSLGVNPSDPEAQLIFDQVRYALVVNSAANGLCAPFDTIYPDIKNLEGLQAFALHGKGLGMGGMLCIHPSQVETASVAYRAPESEIAWAERVLNASKDQPGVFKFEGRMIDAPVLLSARKILESQGKI
uniref:Citramalyl-CoA lyase n=1 Tax=Pseudomonas sp. L1 TaxID=323104 RepID=Q14DY8_9PSED|nr:citramalyl-CoA lyase [Pseudomonas sp. L1]